MRKLYVLGDIDETCKSKTANAVEIYKIYSDKISRTQRLAKALTKRREVVINRVASKYRKNSNTIKYIATFFYWTTTIKKSTIESFMRRGKSEHVKFMDALYPVYEKTCSICNKPMVLKSRTEYLSQYSFDKCKPCRDEEFNASSLRYKESIRIEQQNLHNLKTMPYKDYLQSEHWQSLRHTMLKRAGYKCSLCGEGKPLHVHHNTYERRGQERLSDLVVLCHECHESYHEVKHEA